MVATGDDPERESPNTTMNKKNERKASQKQVEILSSRYTGDNLTKLLTLNGVERIEDLPMSKASDLIGRLMNG